MKPHLIAFAAKTWYGWRLRFIDSDNKPPTDKPCVLLYHRPFDYDAVVIERDAYKKIATAYINREINHVKEALAQVPAIRSKEKCSG